jgi:hypothetical protein
MGEDVRALKPWISEQQSISVNNLELDQQATQKSELQQWPVQMHLVNPRAPYFQNADVVLAADCVAFAMGDFHQTWLKGKSLAIACPKLDSATGKLLPKAFKFDERF